MDRRPVSSSNIASIGYDDQSSTLEVEFNNGSIYQYFDISEDLYNQFMQADSKGAYLASHIKGNYRFSKV